MKTVEEIFSAFKSKTVLVVGDVMIDSYIFGTKNKSTDFPIVSAKRKEKRLGGAANVALNIQALGATPILCSVVGDDHDGQTFERLLDHQEMSSKGIIRSQNRKTTNKLRILSGSQLMIRVDTEDTLPLEDLDRKALLNHVRDLIDECDLIIFEDYDKGTVNAEIISETIDMATKKGIPVAADPRQQNFLTYEGVSIFKPDVAELEKYLNESIDLDNEASMIKALKALDEKIHAENYILSLDSGDIFYYSKDLKDLFPSFQTGISDMSGVGNTVISIAALGLSVGLSPRVIAQLSNIAKGIVSKYTGVVPIAKDQLIKEIQENQILVQ